MVVKLQLPILLISGKVGVLFGHVAALKIELREYSVARGGIDATPHPATFAAWTVLGSTPTRPTDSSPPPLQRFAPKRLARPGYLHCLSSPLSGYKAVKGSLPHPYSLAHLHNTQFTLNLATFIPE